MKPPDAMPEIEHHVPKPTDKLLSMYDSYMVLYEKHGYYVEVVLIKNVWYKPNKTLTFMSYKDSATGRYFMKHDCEHMIARCENHFGY